MSNSYSLMWIKKELQSANFKMLLQHLDESEWLKGNLINTN